MPGIPFVTSTKDAWVNANVTASKAYKVQSRSHSDMEIAVAPPTATQLQISAAGYEFLDLKGLWTDTEIFVPTGETAWVRGDGQVYFKEIA